MELPYRLEIGERRGKIAYILQSRRGIVRRSLPRTLEKLVDDPTCEILDVSLGIDGRYFVNYEKKGKLKSRISSNQSGEIEPEVTERVARVSLSEAGNFWAVSKDESQSERAFSKAPSSFKAEFFNQTEGISSFEGVKFLALGFADSWAFKINGKTYYNGPARFKAVIAEAENRGIEVLNVVFSPIGRHWLVMLGDGSVQYDLPDTIANKVEKYMRPKYALVKSIRIAAEVQEDITLRPLQPGTADYDQVYGLFHRGWKHDNKENQTVHGIYAIELPPAIMKPYETYRTNVATKRGLPNGKERLLFHGTNRTCCLGNSKETLDLCFAISCNLCQIIRTSFKISRAGTAPTRTFCRFGQGIYTTPTSSKADHYAGPESRQGYKALLVARVAVGKTRKLYCNQRKLVAPPPGYDSVHGKAGGSLNYAEYVVYSDDAIRPAYLVVYKEQAWPDLWRSITRNRLHLEP